MLVLGGLLKSQINSDVLTMVMAMNRNYIPCGEPICSKEDCSFDFGVFL